MSTLTGGQHRLDTHCIHKLPTFCQLLSSPKCCACQDTRPHSNTYPAYVDGVGIMETATRWTNYCWRCKEFWTNRIEAAPDVYVESTKIPHYPNQDYFCKLWHEHRQGYRVAIAEDGREERIPLVGEPWVNVAPGHLPRTQAEVEYGIPSSREMDADEAASAQRLQALDVRSPANRRPGLLENEQPRRRPAPQPQPQPRQTAVIEEQQQVFTVEELQRMRQAYANFAHPRPIGLDVGVHPEPLQDEQMKVDLSCGICYQQIANIVCLPCGHVAMCLWCADMTIPTRLQDATKPLHPDAACPICRKQVTQRVKVFYSN